MWEKTKIVKAQVERVYELYPSTRGNNTLLAKRMLDVFYPDVHLSARQFKLLLTVPSFETMFRRGREIRRAKPEFQPTERTRQKRKAREIAFRHAYGSGLTLMDFTLKPEQLDVSKD